MNTIQEILLRKHLQKLIEAGRKASAEILTEKFPAGQYLLVIEHEESRGIIKIIKQ